MTEEHAEDIWRDIQDLWSEIHRINARLDNLSQALLDSYSQLSNGFEDLKLMVSAEFRQAYKEWKTGDDGLDQG